MSIRVYHPTNKPNFDCVDLSWICRHKPHSSCCNLRRDYRGGVTLHGIYIIIIYLAISAELVMIIAVIFRSGGTIRNLGRIPITLPAKSCCLRIAMTPFCIAADERDAYEVGILLCPAVNNAVPS